MVEKSESPRHAAGPDTARRPGDPRTRACATFFVGSRRRLARKTGPGLTRKAAQGACPQRSAARPSNRHRAEAPAIIVVRRRGCASDRRGGVRDRRSMFELELRGQEGDRNKVSDCTRREARTCRIARSTRGEVIPRQRRPGRAGSPDDRPSHDRHRMTTSTTSTTSTTPTAPTASDPPVLSESDLHGWLAVGRAGSCNGHAVARGVRGVRWRPRAVRGGPARTRGAGVLACSGRRPASGRLGRGAPGSGFPRAYRRIDRADWNGGYPHGSPPSRARRRCCTAVATRSPRPPPGRRRRRPSRHPRGRASGPGYSRASSPRAGWSSPAGSPAGSMPPPPPGALDVGAASIAVAATGPDRIYPRSNAGLARELLEAGALVTERAPGTPPLPSNFPRRNRLISGLGLGVLVVEASLPAAR